MGFKYQNIASNSRKDIIGDTKQISYSRKTGWNVHLVRYWNIVVMWKETPNFIGIEHQESKYFSLIGIESQKVSMLSIP